MEQVQRCCICDSESKYTYLGKPYCEPHISERTLRTEVYSRIVGYLRPLQSWSKHKKHEFEHRETYVLDKMLPKEQIERPDVCGCQGEG